MHRVLLALSLAGLFVAALMTMHKAERASERRDAVTWYQPWTPPPPPAPPEPTFVWLRPRSPSPTLRQRLAAFGRGVQNVALATVRPSPCGARPARHSGASGVAPAVYRRPEPPSFFDRFRGLLNWIAEFRWPCCGPFCPPQSGLK